MLQQRAHLLTGSGGDTFTKTSTNAYSAGNVLGSQNLSPEMTTEAEVKAYLETVV